MTDYKAMYNLLVQNVDKTISQLKDSLLQAEEIYLSGDEKDFEENGIDIKNEE